LGFLVEKLTLRLPNINPWACLSTGSRLRVTAEGLRVNPERRFFTPPSGAGLCAAEWFKINYGIEGLRARRIEGGA